jgi:hypothetical protein
MDSVQAALDRLATLSQNGHEEELRKFFNELLPEARVNITHSEAGAVPGIAKRANGREGMSITARRT